VNEEYLELYGPPALNPPYKPGQTLFYDDNGTPENGTILYVAAENRDGQPDLRYIVSPAEAAFPTPVWPDQIITAM
jgi:hypothetical protein